MSLDDATDGSPGYSWTSNSIQIETDEQNEIGRLRAENHDLKAKLKSRTKKLRVKRSKERKLMAQIKNLAAQLDQYEPITPTEVVVPEGWDVPDSIEFQIAFLDGRMWVSVRKDGPEGRHYSLYDQVPDFGGRALALVEAVAAYADAKTSGSWTGGWAFDKEVERWRQAAQNHKKRHP